MKYLVVALMAFALFKNIVPNFFAAPIAEPETQTSPSVSAANYQCDGRVYCSQMTSCAEAMYFLQHCPNVKMDGNGDGRPCERQWCG